MSIYERFAQFEDDYLKFEDIEVKQSNRPDLNAFLMLSHLVPGTADIIGGAEHDQIFLNVCLKKLDEAASDGQIRDLVRCGVRVSEYECLAMHV